jgi:hypothetical protein
MREVSGGGGRIASRHLGEADDSGATALMSLRDLQGAATVLSLADVESKVKSFTFKESSGEVVIWGVKGAIADVVLLSFPMKGSEVELKLRDFDGPGEKSVVVKVSGGYADIVLGNLPPYIINRAACKKRDGSHFGHFYDLIADGQAPKKKKLPFSGNKEKDQFDIEAYDKWPPVLQFVEGREPCIDFWDFIPSNPEARKLWKGKVFAASNRAICAVASFDAPPQD